MPQDILVGILGLAAIAACWVLAAVLFSLGPKGSMARRLAILLVIEGVTLLTAGFPNFVLGLDDAFWQQHLPYLIVLFVTHHLSDAAMIVLYPIFLAYALRTKFTRPFARTGVQIAMSIAGLGLAAGTVVTMALWESSVGSMLLYVTVMLTFFFAFLAAIHAWRTAKPGLARTRAGLFAVAFGIRDICWSFAYGASFWMLWTGATDWEESQLFWTYKAVYAVGTLLAVPLIAYGILRGLLFDIDLKIRWTIKQSTLAGIFVAVIFLISEGANQFLAAELGNIVGLLAAAVVMFFLAPLQRFADRVAGAAMPNTENTPEYRAFRKMQVYESAVAEALAEGGISPKERSLLNRLRDSLGISQADAAAIERQISGDGNAELPGTTSNEPDPVSSGFS